MSMGASGGLEEVSASGQLVLSIIKSEFSFVENCLVMAHFFLGGGAFILPHIGLIFTGSF